MGTKEKIVRKGSPRGHQLEERRGEPHAGKEFGERIYPLSKDEEEAGPVVEEPRTHAAR